MAKGFQVRANFTPPEVIEKAKRDGWDKLPEIVTYGIVKKSGFWSVIKIVTKGYVAIEVEIFQEDLKAMAMSKMFALMEEETEWGKV